MVDEGGWLGRFGRKSDDRDLGMVTITKWFTIDTDTAPPVDDELMDPYFCSRRLDPNLVDLDTDTSLGSIEPCKAYDCPHPCLRKRPPHR